VRIAFGVLSLASFCNAEGIQSGAQPACTAAVRGLVWNVEGAAGVADSSQICQKTAGDTYAWSSGVFVNSGTIIAITSGSCAAGWTEATELSGKMPYGTLAANGDVGGTGGSDAVTPAGTNSAPAFTGSALGTHLHGVGTFANSSTSGGTPAGTNATSTVTPSGTITWPAGVPTNASGAFTQGAISWPAGVPTAANESAHTHSVTAAGTNGSVSITPLGTNAASATSGNCAATNIAAGTGSTTACKATAPNLTVSAQTFTGSSTTVGAQTFTGSSVTSGAGSAHTHTLSWPAGVPTIAAGSFTQPTISWPAGVPAFSGSSSTVAAQVFTGSALSTHTHTVSGSSEAVSAGTPAGTVAAPVFSGTQFDNRSAYVKVIFCRKT